MKNQGLAMKDRPITPQQVKALQAQFHKMGFSDEDDTDLSVSSLLVAPTALPD